MPGGRSLGTLPLLGLLLSGCAGLVPLAEAERQWLGRPLGDLVAAWGPPVSSYHYEDGTSRHSWMDFIVRRRWTEPCSRSVLVDAAGITQRWLSNTCPRPQPRRSMPP